MINYQTELKYFNETYALLEHCEKCEEVKKVLYKLIELNTIEDIATYYNSIKNSSNIIFPRLDEDMKTERSLEDIRTRIVICAIDRLLQRKNDLLK